MNIRKTGALLALGFATLNAGIAQEPAQDPSNIQARIQALEQELQSLKQLIQAQQSRTNESSRVEELDQKVRVLDRKQELQDEAAAEKAKSSVSVSAGPGGFSIQSADTNFVLKLRAYVQADSRLYTDDHEAGSANDTFLIRRARPILEGTLFEKYDFRMMFDFGSGITSSAGNNGFLQDAYLTARLLPEFQVRIGKMKEPVGLERLQSGANLLFVERSYPTQLVPNRDVGVQIQGDLFGELLHYDAGVFNGVADGGSGDVETSDDEKDFAARLFATPFKKSDVDVVRNLGFGVAGTFGDQEGSLRSLASPGQQRIFAYRSGSGASDATANVMADGERWRISPQAYWYWGSFGLFGEYVLSDQEIRRDAGISTSMRARNTAWQVAASYVLTGEENSWKGVTPQSPFNPGKGGWGAWEIAARFSQLDLDDDLFPLYASSATSATVATSWGLGVNWYLNKNVKLTLNYEQTDFDGGTSDLLKSGEKVIFTRAQLSF